VGDYKGASEQMARSTPSPQWDQNINQLLDSMYANVRKPLMVGRNLDGAKLDEAMKVTWLADSADAKGVGLVDSVIDLPMLSSHLKDAYGKQVTWVSNVLRGTESSSAMDFSNPFALLTKLGQKPDFTPTSDTIAVVHITGPIVDGESSGGGGLMGGGANVGSRTIRNALEDIRKQDLIKGVVMRIDSPGGSATASEIIWQGVKRVAEKKPVWVSVGGMAASGGYYIAVSGDKIYVNPSSIVGSIGVVGGKISMQELYSKFKVNVVGRGRGPMADMFASGTGWDDQDKALVRAKMTDTYNLFTKRVSAGRPGIDLSKTAEGRLFTGDKAIGLGMADKVGGLESCINDLASSLSLDEPDIQHYPAPRPFEEVLKESLGGIVQAPGVQVRQRPGAIGPATGQLLSVVREIMGDNAYRQIDAELRGFLQLRDERVLLVSPRALIFR
jgi:protease IV